MQRTYRRTFGQLIGWPKVRSIPPTPYTNTLEVTATLMHTPNYGSLRSTRGPAPAPPLNNKKPTVAADHLLCVPPCVCTAFCAYRLACGPLNNMTPAVATDRLLCALPCVCTAFCVYRLACGPLNNMTPAVAADRLLCVPPCVCTAFCVYDSCGGHRPPFVCTALCVHRLLCVPPCLWPLK